MLAMEVMEKLTVKKVKMKQLDYLNLVKVLRNKNKMANRSLQFQQQERSVDMGESMG